MDFWQRQNGGGAFILPLSFFERREAMGAASQASDGIPRQATPEMFKINI
ncbi:MAG TPA: hypothetical protein VEZ52_07790 [Desulfovibrio sp.]|nr:hypothetical protein [Desulfovibrio sp.]HZF61505.1 hypothetical protein [Desulfovibrio sp.]